MFSNYISLSQTLIYITQSTTERSPVITFMPFQKRHCFRSEGFGAKQPCHQRSTLQTAFNNIKKSEKVVAVCVEAIRYLHCQNSVFTIWAVRCKSGVSHFFCRILTRTTSGKFSLQCVPSKSVLSNVSLIT